MEEFWTAKKSLNLLTHPAIDLLQTRPGDRVIRFQGGETLAVS